MMTRNRERLMSEIPPTIDRARLRISFLHTIATNQPLADEAGVAMGLSSENI